MEELHLAPRGSRHGGQRDCARRCPPPWVLVRAGSRRSGHLVGDDPKEEGHQLLRVRVPGGWVPVQWLSESGRQ